MGQWYTDRKSVCNRFHLINGCYFYVPGQKMNFFEVYSILIWNEEPKIIKNKKQTVL